MTGPPVIVLVILVPGVLENTRMQAPCLAMSADPGLLRESQLGSWGHTSQWAVGSEGH